MTAPTAFAPVRTELPESAHPVVVTDAEYHRLLGYPAGYVPTDRARDLIRATRAWYAENGRPWRYCRAARLSLGGETLWIDDEPFHSAGLRRRFESAGVDRVILVAVSAGAGCEQRARVLWEEEKPDEYFFLEAYGSAVVEALIAQLNARICAGADQEGRFALPHYSPGYTDWDITEQSALLRAVEARLTAPLPEPLTVLPSGMLVPRKALLGVVGLTPRTPATAPGATPCTDCAFTPCQYRRAPYRHHSAQGATFAGGAIPLTATAMADRSDSARETAGLAAPQRTVPRYRVPERALRKWAGERVALERRPDGSVSARFRFDGTTCSNLGQPIALDYELDLGAAREGHVIRQAACRPAAGDEGLRKTCAYLSGAEGLERALAEERPALGTRLDDAVASAPDVVASGCTCTADGRAHKWSMALQAVHFALHHSS